MILLDSNAALLAYYVPPCYFMRLPTSVLWKLPMPRVADGMGDSSALSRRTL